MSKKYVYLFTEGNANMRELLGGKGANLAEMTNIGLPVPQGFTITTEACTQYYEDGRQINDEIQAEINEYIGKMEEMLTKLVSMQEAMLNGTSISKTSKKVLKDEPVDTKPTRKPELETKLEVKSEIDDELGVLPPRVCF